MKTLTIRGIDPQLAEEIRKRAIKSGESINKLMLNLLRSALGLGNKKEFPIYHDLDHLAGTWTEEDEIEFNQNIQAFEKIDEDMWE